MPSTRRALASTAAVVLLTLALVAAPVAGDHGSTASDTELTRDIYTTERGGVVTFGATGVDGTVKFVIGEKSVGYRVVLVADDTDGDGRVTVRFDTYRSPDGAAAYTVVGDDEVASVEVTDGVSRVIAPTTYDVLAESGGSESISAIVVEERSPELGTLRAPATDDLTTAEAVRTGLRTNTSDCLAPVACDPAVTRTSTVARGEQLVVPYDGAVRGVIATQNATAAGFETRNATTRFLAAVETGRLPFTLTTGDGTALTPRLGPNNTRVVADHANGTHYLVVNTSRLSAVPTDETTLTVRAGSATDRITDATATANVTLVPPSGRLATQTVPQTPEPTLTAATNLAPGTDVLLLAQTTDNASRLFLNSVEATVGRDGRVRTTLDVNLSESEPGDRFTVRPLRPAVAEDLFDTEVVVQPATPTPTATQTPTGTPTPTPTATQTPTGTSTPTPTPTPTPTAAGPTSTPTTATSVPTPGLGAVVAALAVLAAVGLVRRR